MMNNKNWLKIIESRGTIGMAINRKWCPQEKNIKAFKKLIKAGKVKRIRYGSTRCRTTILVAV
ncbi:MAG TPA: hypothetical protein V6C58_18740 [Allocoleopsis sp.]